MLIKSLLEKELLWKAYVLTLLLIVIENPFFEKNQYFVGLMK